MVRDDSLRIDDNGVISHQSVEVAKDPLLSVTIPTDDNVSLHYNLAHMNIFPDGNPEDVVWVPFPREERGRVFGSATMRS
jgi:hypothetical protein